MKNDNWFNAMLSFRWTINNIQSAFNCPTAIARHIQSTCNFQHDAKAIATASRAMINQIGF